jgi:Domain of unknown function (DUF6249)
MDMGWLVPTVFWAAVVLIVALNVRARMAAERERQQTLRTLIERGQPLDADLVRQLLAGSTERKSPFALVVAGIVVAAFGLGLALLGVFIGQIDSEALLPLLGSGGLFFMVGVGLLVAALVQRRLQQASGPAPLEDIGHNGTDKP